MRRIGLTWLLKIELPSSVTVRLCDGGMIKWGAETYKAKDAVFGAAGAADGLAEGVGDEVPALELQLLPPGTSTPAQLSQPGFQQALVWFWLADYDPATGLVTGTPDPLFSGQIDTTELAEGRSERILSMAIVALIERLFERNIGNSLSPVWHKSVWPGETGHDNATGLTVPVAWGAERPAGGSYAGGTYYAPGAFAGRPVGGGGPAGFGAGRFV